MTSQKSLDKSFKSMFKTRLKSAIPFPLFGSLILFIFSVILPFNQIQNIINNPDHIPEIGIDEIRYILLGTLKPMTESFPDVIVLVYMALIICSILCGILLFKNLSSKRTANIYYALPFSRTKLFISTYASGAVAIIGMVVVPLFISFVFNALAFGFSKELLCTTIFTTSVLCNVSLIAYTLSAIAMIMSGMLIEGAFFAFFLNSVTAIFTFACNMFSESLLTGGGFADLDTKFYGTFEGSFGATFFGKIADMNSLAHSVLAINKISCCLNVPIFEDWNWGEYLSVEKWTSPNATALVIWSLILVGLIALSVLLINRKKVENIGFFASSPVLYRIFFGTLIVGFSALGCSSGKYVTKGVTWIWVLIILAICLAVTLLINFILTKISKMKLKKEIKFFGIYSLAAIGLGLVFTTGFFGYTNRMPAPEKVADVSITHIMPGIDDDYFVNEVHNYRAGGTSVLMGSYSPSNLYVFKSTSDIANVQEIHKDLIEADNAKITSDFRTTEINGTIQIVYALNNGKTISRKYVKLTPEIIDKYFTLEGLDEATKNLFLERVNLMMSFAEDKAQNFLSVFPNDMMSATNIDLTESEIENFKVAYSQDFENLSAKDIFMTKGKNLGFISIREEYNVYEGYNEMDEPISIGYGSELETESFNIVTVNQYYHCGMIPINENMTNTIKWAKEVGIYELFENDYDIGVSDVQVTHINKTSIKESLSETHSNGSNLLFFGTSFREGDTYSRDYLEYYAEDSATNLMSSYTVSNFTHEQMKYLRENAHPFYLATSDGYFIQLISDEEKSLYSTLFIPESKLTPELKDKLENG